MPAITFYFFFVEGGGGLEQNAKTNDLSLSEINLLCKNGDVAGLFLSTLHLSKNFYQVVESVPISNYIL